MVQMKGFPLSLLLYLVFCCKHQQLPHFSHRSPPALEDNINISGYIMSVNNNYLLIKFG